MTKELQEPNELQEQDKEFVDEFRQVILDNDKIIAEYNAKYLPEAPATPPEWHYLGEMKVYEETDTGIIFTCEHGYAEMIWFAPDIVRVRVQQESDDFNDYFSYAAVNLDHLPVNFRVRESVPYASDIEDTTLYIETDTHTYRVDKAQFSIAVDTRYGRVIYSETGGISWHKTGESRLQSELRSDESSYGTGERAFDLNLRGRKLIMENTDPGGYQRGDDPVNYCIPFYLGVHDAGCYGLLWDNSSRGSIDIGATIPDELKHEAQTGAISYYLFMGTDVNSVLERYTSITGRMPLPPLWSLGYHQCRYSYRNAEDLLDTATQFRERNIPCDVIYLDIHYMNEYRVFTWDEEAFPDMKSVVDKLHAMDMKLVVILDPGVKVDEGYFGHDTGVEQDIFLTYPDGKIAAGVVWPGLCYFPDFTDPRARSWWADQLNDLLNTGIDGLWNDMNEPLIFTTNMPSALPAYLQHDKEGRGGTHQELQNVYGMLMGRASREALEQHRPDKRQFTFVRAGGAGAQRYAASWTGDNYSTWDDLRVSISMTLGMGLSGVPFTGADVGGFNYDTTGELLTRWTQAAALLPLFRNHSSVSYIRQEPWQFGSEYEQHIADAIRLRYKLMPYLYSIFAECSFTGHPIVRPVFMAEPNNPHLRDIDDCYLLGDKLLVAPVMTEGQLRRTVYLPDGMWYDFNTNQRYEGDNIVRVDAPLGTLPLFVKSGTTLPIWDVRQSVDDAHVEKLILRVYTDTGETQVYEDAGDGLGYQNGDYRWVRYMAIESTDHLLLERTVDGDYTPHYSQIELQLVGASQQIGAVEVDGEAVDNWSFVGGVVYATLPPDFESVKVGV